MDENAYPRQLAHRIDAALSYLNVSSPGIATLESVIVRPPSAEKGDFAFPVFRFVPKGQNPVQFALQLVGALKSDATFERFAAAGPYVNAFLNQAQYAQQILEGAAKVPPVPGKDARLVMVEYAQPNTNKPFHVGHLRNICLAQSIIRLLAHDGNRVMPGIILNDRGAHICKSMLAYQKWGNGKTPQSEKMKPDHFVGHYYAEFTKHAKDDPKLEEEILDMLVKWENNDPVVRALWSKMNAWAIEGLNQTLNRMGATFEQTDYESQIYDKGKELVLTGLKKGVLKEAENGAVIAPLEKYELPEKPLLRANGTTLYITQDIYLAISRFQALPDLDRLIYVVASEQEMHFKQLFAILDLLGYPQEKLYHLSYGLLTLPSGKMSSREGTVVHADDLLSELEALAFAEYQKRSPELPDEEVQRRSRVVAMAALRFFMVKQDARKELVFDPQESISFEGQTGPYLLYTNARILSILRKSTHSPAMNKSALLTLAREKELLTLLAQKNEIFASALRNYSPHVLAHYVLGLANTFNTYYHESKIIQENPELEQARLALANGVRQVLEEGLFLLGIETLREM